jgi:amidase
MKVFKHLAIMFLFAIALNVNAEINESTTINDIHQQIKSKQLTSEQLVQFYLQRIAEFDDKGMTLNSVVQLNKNALKQAQCSRPN